MTIQRKSTVSFGPTTCKLAGKILYSAFFLKNIKQGSETESDGKLQMMEEGTFKLCRGHTGVEYVGRRGAEGRKAGFVSEAVMLLGNLVNTCWSSSTSSCFSSTAQQVHWSLGLRNN